MAHTVIRQRWRTFPTPKRLLFPSLHGRPKSARSMPPACRHGSMPWPARFAIMGLLLFGTGCVGVATQLGPVPAQAHSEGATPNRCLRALSALPKPSIAARYVGNTVLITAIVEGNGSDTVEAVQIDYARPFQLTQSVIAEVVDGTATATVSVDAGHSYNYTARAHGPPVGAGYHCSRFGEVKNITVPLPTRN